MKICLVCDTRFPAKKNGGTERVVKLFPVLQNIVGIGLWIIILRRCALQIIWLCMSKW